MRITRKDLSRRSVDVGNNGSGGEGLEKKAERTWEKEERPETEEEERRETEEDGMEKDTEGVGKGERGEKWE